MKGKSHLIKTNGDIVVTELNKPVTLEMLKEAVGGWIELVPMFVIYNKQNCVAFCNEEGKLMQLPFNHKATELWHKQRVPNYVGDELVGDVIVITGDNELMRTI